MNAETIDEILIKKKQQYVKLIEVSDFTRQLAEAVDNQDEVSVKIMLSVRQEPLVFLQELDEHIKTTVEHLPEDDAIRMSELLKGADAQTKQEQALAEQVAQNRRLLEKILELDKRISLKIDPKRSFYNMFRS